MSNIKRERVVIIGSGPAGFAAALYTAFPTQSLMIAGQRSRRFP